VEVCESSRGGDITYHGPGQLVGYPIVRLAEGRRDVHRFLRGVEATLIAALAAFGIDGHRREGLTGVWVGDAKIAAIGIAFTRWVSYHGFALNVATDLDAFRLIVPCGIADKPVTSMARVLGAAPAWAEVEAAVTDAFLAQFGFAAARLCAWPDDLPEALR
ncbi:MAG: lipoyl(octanoyl) transferase LipB, partial [Planctomycetota bacterium]